MNKTIFPNNLIIVVLASSLLCGCGLLSKRQISQAEAQKIIYKSLGSFFPQFLPDKIDLKIEGSAGGDDDLVSGSITGHLSEPTFLIDKTINMPSGRQVNFVRPDRTNADTIEIPVSARFLPTSDDWVLSNPPNFGVDPSAFGSPLSKLNGAVDESTDTGKSLLAKGQAYEEDIKEQDELSKKISDLTELENQLSSNVTWDGVHPNFKTITYYFGGFAALQGFENGNVWLKLRQAYPEEWNRNNLGHLFDRFPDVNGSTGPGCHILTYDQWQQLVPPIIDRTVARDLDKTKSKLIEVQKNIPSLQDDLRKY